MISRITRGFAVGLALSAAILFAPALEAQDPAPTARPPVEGPAALEPSEPAAVVVTAARATAPIQVDGQLDEALYTSVPPITDFRQSLPTEGAEATERTEAWVAFDESNVYVAARVWDSAPEADWIANEIRRDASAIEANDQFGVFFDTFQDRRNSVGFFVNPIGGFSDVQISGEEAANADWNPTTEVSTGRFEGGWTVEMAIPFRALRYRSGSEQVWGIQMRRSIVRKNEWNHLSPIPLSMVRNGAQGALRVSRYGTLVGIEAPPSRRNVEVKPYGIGGLRTDLIAEPQFSNDGYADAGLDVKYGITENLTADFTFNTDFAQVEVDEQQVNLTRFNLFFPEKREFFLEGQGIFEFGSGGRPEGGGGGGGGGPGAGTSGRGRGGRSAIAPTFFHSRQIGLQDGVPLPILGGSRLTGKVGSFDVGGVAIRTDDAGDVEATNFGVLRLRRDILARSSVGLLVEGKSNSSVAPEGGNLAYGVDANFALYQNIQIFGYYAKTDTEGLDGRDDSFRARVGYRGDILSGSVDHVMVGDDFNPEVGFLRRDDFRETNVFGRFSPRPASIPWIRQITIAGQLGYIESVSGGFLDSRNRGGRVEVELQNSDWWTAVFTESYERLDEETTISGATFPSGRYSFNDLELGYTFGPHRRVSGNLSVRWGGFFSGDVLSVGFSRGRVELLPRLSLEPNVELNWIDVPTAGGSSQTVEQHVARTRVVYGISPRMYVSGLVQYNSGNGSVSGNFRFRWEWAPGSELFVVYTEDRDTDVLDRWSELSNRGLAIKVTRLFRL